MRLSEGAEEILEALWLREEEGDFSSPLRRGGPFIGELRRGGYIDLRGGVISLTPRGKEEGKKIVRRNRLAERLLVDVLDVKQKLIREVSYRFEHILHEGIEDNICTLLGHPKTCPHGKPIPPEECCRREEEKAKRVIVPLFELEVGEGGRIAYIETREREKLQKLMAMGTLPGIPVKLLQKFPSYVFQMENSQFAVDEEIARIIHIRLSR